MTRPGIMPNFLVIGAAKAGTTSIYHYLKQHPQVFLPACKEPRFFAFEEETLNYRAADGMEPRINTTSITHLRDYQQLFDGVTAETAIGDISPIYLYSKKAPENIKRYIAGARMIVLLRDPVDRAFSNYVYMLMRGMEPCKSFEEALDAEQRRIAENWAPLYHYRERGFYHSQLSAYYRLFRSDQIRIYLFEELKHSPRQVCRDIFLFLGIDPEFVPDTDKDHNVSGIPKNRILQSLLDAARGSSGMPISLLKTLLPKEIRSRIRSRMDHAARNNLIKPELSPETRLRLKKEYRNDITMLQQLIGKDLSLWL